MRRPASDGREVCRRRMPDRGSRSHRPRERSKPETGAVPGVGPRRFRSTLNASCGPSAPSPLTALMPLPCCATIFAELTSWARAQGLARLFLDTRTDLIEARAFYASCGFIEIPSPTTTPGPFRDHWFEKALAESCFVTACDAARATAAARSGWRKGRPAGIPERGAPGDGDAARRMHPGRREA
jgi:hypothetical protein